MGRRESLGRAVAVAVALALAGATAREGAAQLVLDGSMHRLGKPGEAEWEEFEKDRPEGEGLTVRFRSPRVEGESTLFVRQRDVKLDRVVRLNGRSLGTLVLSEADLVHALAVPPGVVRDGENTLQIGPAAGIDDVVVGELALDPRPRGRAVGGATLDVRVTDGGTGQPLPCRVTVVDARGVLVPLAVDPSPRLAVRPGVAYTADGAARLGLRPGRYTVHATRGFEYGVATREATVAEGETRAVALAVRREVPTPGLVACDTHVHTLTFSGHGDATVEERVVTLAGEGVELPVATDHDHFTDLDGPARRLKLRDRFTPIVGDEVTTRRGHFNAFPFDPAGTPPDSTLTHWPDLFRAVRAGSPDRLIVLNHPRDLHAGFRPFGGERFDAVVGDDRDGVAFGFDAVEVVNSGALQSDPMRGVRDWFALWNHGHEVTAVAASDSHDVSRFIVGQGRTYVATPDDDPGNIDVSAACQSLRAGRAVASLGLLARLTVDGKFAPGDLATGAGATVGVEVVVSGPSWVKADTVELFANGVKVREQRLGGDQTAAEKGRVSWSIPRPAYDVALVAVASGPGVAAPYWPIPRPYQPTSKRWEPRVLSVTNPVRLDGDGNGVWNSPRYYAQFAIEIFGTDPARLFRALGQYDEAVAAQAAAFCLPAGRDRWPETLDRALESAPASVRRGFAAVLASRRGG